MSEPQISVVITSYNQREYLSEAIESVIQQTLRPSEIIVADDCSTDGSIDLIQDYAARHPGWIKAVIQPRNLGVARNRNRALAQVSGDLVSFLDGDDRFLPRKLQREYETYRTRRGVQIVYSNIYYLDETGQRSRLWAEGVAPPEGEVFTHVLGRNYPRGMTFRNELVDTECIREVGGYDESLPRYGDWDLLIRLTRRFRTAYCPEPLTVYRLHSDSLSRAPATVHIDTITRIREKYRPFLADLSELERAEVERKFRQRLAVLSRRAAREAMDAPDRRVAFAHWARSLPLDHGWSPVLLGRILLPIRAYAIFRSAFRGLASPRAREVR